MAHPDDRAGAAKAARRFRSGRAWQRARAQVIEESEVCWICGDPVDRSLPGTHPEGPTVDHVRALARGGAQLDRANLRLAHLRCNSAKRDRVLKPQVTSRRW